MPWRCCVRIFCREMVCISQKKLRCVECHWGSLTIACLLEWLPMLVTMTETAFQTSMCRNGCSAMLQKWVPSCVWKWQVADYQKLCPAQAENCDLRAMSGMPVICDCKQYTNGIHSTLNQLSHCIQLLSCFLFNLECCFKDASKPWSHQARVGQVVAPS